MKKEKAARSLRNWGESSSFSRTFKEKNAPGKLYKSTTENRPFFNMSRIFIINKRVKINNDTYYYWLKENDQFQ